MLRGMMMMMMMFRVVVKISVRYDTERLHKYMYIYIPIKRLIFPFRISCDLSVLSPTELWQRSWIVEHLMQLLLPLQQHYFITTLLLTPLLQQNCITQNFYDSVNMFLFSEPDQTIKCKNLWNEAGDPLFLSSNYPNLKKCLCCHNTLFQVNRESDSSTRSVVSHRQFLSYYAKEDDPAVRRPFSPNNTFT